MSATQKRNLDFVGENTTYLTHGIHSFPARFPPQIVSWAIDEFLEQNSISKCQILDPMCGSGTTLLESYLKGISSYGVDKDPLSRLISKVKTTPLEIKKLQEASQELKNKIAQDIQGYREEFETPVEFPSELDMNGSEISPLELEDCREPDWSNLDYWFYDDVIDELSFINERIKETPNSDFRDFFKLVFSSCLVTKGGKSLVNAHDLAHSRPHRVHPEEHPDTLLRFFNELDEKLKTMEKFYKRTIDKKDSKITPKIIGEEAKELSLDDRTIDLIVTSPPYINAVDYIRATKYSLFWLEWDESDYKEFTGNYVGAERIKKENYSNWVKQSTSSETANSHIDNLKNDYQKMAGVIYKYTQDMEQVIKEMFRVLKPGSKVVLVVGDNHIRGEDVKTHIILNQLAEHCGFDLKEKILREIDSNKRQLPVKRGNMNDGMANEWVLIWEA